MSERQRANNDVLVPASANLCPSSAGDGTSERSERNERVLRPSPAILAFSLQVTA
jgi:hypothetical protein